MSTFRNEKSMDPQSGRERSEGRSPERSELPDGRDAVPGEPLSGLRGPPPDPHVDAMAKRRVFSAAEKARIVHAAEACTRHGDIGALLRREGIYASQLALWRKQVGEGGVESLSRRRGRRKDPDTEVRRELAKLKHEHEKLQRKLHHAELIIEVQKKVSALLAQTEHQETKS